MTYYNIDERFNNSNFAISFSKFPNLKFEITGVKLPNVSTGSSVYPIPYSNVPLISDKVTYGTLDINFLLNNNLSTWITLFEWLTINRNGEAFKEYSGLQDLYSDVTIICYDNDNVPLIEFTCHDCFPLEISYPELDSTISNQISNNVSVSFEISHMSYKLK